MRLIASILLGLTDIGTVFLPIVSNILCNIIMHVLILFSESYILSSHFETVLIRFLYS